jgi:bacterioferritin
MGRRATAARRGQGIREDCPRSGGNFRFFREAPSAAHQHARLSAEAAVGPPGKRGGRFYRTFAPVSGLNHQPDQRRESTHRGPATRPMKKTTSITRKEMIRLLNKDLSREYQAIIAYTVYSQTMKGAKYLHIAGELKKHASEELGHAMLIAKQIDYFNGTPVVEAQPVKMSDKPDDMLRFDLENERNTIINYRQRIRQAEAMGEYGLSEVLREIVVQEQEHLTDLAAALGIDNPKLSD